MTADTIWSYVQKTLFTNDELQLDKASYSNIAEYQWNDKICAYYIIGSKYNKSFDHIKNDYDIKEYVLM